MTSKTTPNSKKILQELNQYTEQKETSHDIERFVKEEPIKKVVKPKFWDGKIKKLAETIKSATTDKTNDKSTSNATKHKIHYTKYLTYALVIVVLLFIVYSCLFLLFRIDRQYPKSSQFNVLPIGLVDGEMVWFNDLNQDVRTLLAFYQKNYDNGTLTQIPPQAEIEKAVWERIVSEITIKHFAQHNNIAVTPVEITNEVENIIREFGSRGELENFIKKNYIWNLNQFEKKIIAPYLLRNKVILWFEQKESVKTSVTQLAEQIYQDIIANKITFSEANDKYSKDSAAKSRGGSLGTFTWGTMVPEFEQALKQLKVGEISKPVQTEFDWHIIRRDPLPAEETDTTKVAASHILITAFDFDEWLKTERGKNNVVLWLRIP